MLLHLSKASELLSHGVNPSTQIKYQLPVAADVKLTIFNLLGQQVRTLVDEKQLPGFYSAEWDGLNDFGFRVASGLYLSRIEANSPNSTSFVQTKKILLLK